MHTGAVEGSGVALRRLLAPACLLVLALLLAHVALMAGERHGEVMGPLHGHAASRSAAPVLVAPEAVGTTGGGVVTPEPAPHAPPASLGDCPARQAVLPLLVLLFLLVGTPRLFAVQPGGAGPFARPWGSRFSLPPPLAPARRRALLQVFLN